MVLQVGPLTALDFATSSGGFSILTDVAGQISTVIGPWAKSGRSDWLFGPKLERGRGSFISCISFTIKVFRCVLASLYEGLSVRPSVCPSVRRSVRHTLLFCNIMSSLRSFYVILSYKQLF